MKKILFVLVALTFMLTLLVACGSAEHDPMSGEKPSQYSKGLDYEVNGKNCTITGIGSCKDTEIYIPEEIDGKKVTAIGAKAFEGNTTVTKIWLPDTIIKIERRAFMNCTSLKVANISKNVTKIDKQIFDGCILDEFYMYAENYWDSVELNAEMPECKKLVFGGRCIGSGNGITDSAYKGSRILEEVILLDTLTFMSVGTFSGCENLTSVTIPDSLDRILEDAFRGCTNLASITIPDSVENIGRYAFSNCISLTSIIYDGTMEDWSKVSTVPNWNDHVPATVVHCTDGDVAIQ